MPESSTPTASPSISIPSFADAWKSAETAIESAPSAPSTHAEPSVAAPVAKEPSAPSAPPTPPVTKSDEFRGPAELRKAYESTKAERERIAAEKDALAKEYAEAKSKWEEQSKAPPAEDEEKKTFKTQLEEYKKRFEETDSELRFHNYAKTAEYAEKYAKPIKEALEVAKADMEQLLVTDATGEERVASMTDLAELVNIKDLKDATKRAKELFGDAASEVMTHRRKLLELDKKSHEAIEDFKKHGSEREKQTVAQQQAFKANLLNLWKSETEAVSKMTPELFAKIDGDETANKLLDEGTKIADLAYEAMANPQAHGFTPDKVVKLNAVVRTRAAAFPRLEHLYKKQSEELKGLREKLATYEQTSPGGSKGTRTPDTKGGFKSAKEAAEEIWKGGR